MLTEYPILHRLNGKYHNSRGPAFIRKDNEWSWYLYGYIHRYYGTALGNGDWWIHGAYIKC